MDQPAVGPVANLAYITSCRWVDATDGGLLTALAMRLNRTTSRFARLFRLVAVVVDDDDREFAQAWTLRNLWSPDLSIPGAAGADLGSLMLRISSGQWRTLGSRRLTSDQYLPADTKAEAKAAYERRLITELAVRRVDVVLADSYLPVFGREVLRAFPGRILNVHPAITDPRSPHRIVGRTPTRDTYTRAAFGWIIVDDKRRLGIPPGRRSTVVWNGQRREVVKVAPVREGGVTVHIVTADVDAGPVVLCRRYVITDEMLSIEALRGKNARIRSELVPEALVKWWGVVDWAG